MEPAELEQVLARLLPSYAQDHVRAGRWTEAEAATEARREVDRLLPQGVATPEHHLFVLHVLPAGDAVGDLWLHVRPPKAFVFDLWVDPARRREGLGRAAMVAAEQEARRRGATTLSLHVFGENTAARSLYTSLGFRETNVVMVKDLRDGTPATVPGYEGPRPRRGSRRTRG